jgi:hypothetical protein
VIRYFLTRQDVRKDLFSGMKLSIKTILNNSQQANDHNSLTRRPFLERSAVEGSMNIGTWFVIE